MFTVNSMKSAEQDKSHGTCNTQEESIRSNKEEPEDVTQSTIYNNIIHFITCGMVRQQGDRSMDVDDVSNSRTEMLKTDKGREEYGKSKKEEFNKLLVDTETFLETLVKKTSNFMHIIDAGHETYTTAIKDDNIQELVKLNVDFDIYKRLIKVTNKRAVDNRKKLTEYRIKCNSKLLVFSDLLDKSSDTEINNWYTNILDRECVVFKSTLDMITKDLNKWITIIDHEQIEFLNSMKIINRTISSAIKSRVNNDHQEDTANSQDQNNLESTGSLEETQKEIASVEKEELANTEQQDAEVVQSQPKVHPSKTDDEGWKIARGAYKPKDPAKRSYIKPKSIK